MSKLMETEEYSCVGIIDSHAHYFDRRFENEIEGGAEALLRDTVFAGGISGIINVGTNPDNCLRCIDQAKRYDGMYVAVGIHPEDMAHTEMSLDQMIDSLRALLENREENKIVAIGEIGLDYYWEPYDKEAQKA